MSIYDYYQSGYWNAISFAYIPDGLELSPNNKKAYCMGYIDGKRGSLEKSYEKTASEVLAAL